MSRRAVSCEHLQIFAHFDEVSLPSKPSKSILSIFCWRSFSSFEEFLSQKSCLKMILSRIVSEAFIAFSKQG